MAEKALIIVPTYNERENIPTLISQVLDKDARLEILVVDDNSPDKTGDLVEEIGRAQPRVHLLRRPGKMGLGTAYRDGFRWALAREYEYIFEMDADFSHDPNAIPQFLEAIRAERDAARNTLLAYARDLGLKIVDFKFIDLPGTWQHFSIPTAELEESLFSDGLGFDGSSIRGFQAINESDMLLMPDPTTAVADPVCSVPTLSIVCSVLDPVTRKPYNRDPRYIGAKAEDYLRQTGIADISYWGPEAEFFIFDNVRFDQNQYSAYHFIDSDEGIWNSGLDHGNKNLGYKIRNKEGYFPVPPADSQQDLRSEMILKLISA